ncbi:MAG: hypothetical protein WCP98_00445 [Actinomycetes bacterium]
MDFPAIAALASKAGPGAANVGTSVIPANAASAAAWLVVCAPPLEAEADGAAVSSVVPPQPIAANATTDRHTINTSAKMPYRLLFIPPPV